MEASKKKIKKENPSSAFASRSKREAVRKKLVHRDPGILKVQDALEHIIVTGAKVRRDDWRRREFEQREESRSTPDALRCPPLNATEAATIYGSQKRKRKRKGPTNTVVCHAEDLRIYGKRHNSHLPPFMFTPKTKQSEKQKERRSDDSEWNFEHGDSIPPILFRMARLSDEYPSEEQLSRFHDPTAILSKSFTSTDITLEEQDVPRALIEKCWERAVHIASNTMVAPVAAASKSMTEVEIPSGPATFRQQPSSSMPFDSNTPLSREICREKCESLGVDIESLRAKLKPTDAVSETTCPRCTRSFSTTDELLNHFYGTTHTIGCCRALIRPRHLALIRNLLQAYTESQTDQLGVVLLSQEATDGQKGDSEQNNKQQREQYDWRDVRRSMEYAVENSTLIPNESSSSDPRTDARHPVQESMDIPSGKSISNDDEEEEATNSQAALPLMLNPMVLEAANRRLIDRYADIPP